MRSSKKYHNACLLCSCRTVGVRVRCGLVSMLIVSIDSSVLVSSLGFVPFLFSFSCWCECIRFWVKIFFDLSHVAEAGYLFFVFGFDFCLFV